MKKENLKRLGIVTLFAIAMAFLESVIVVYIRKMYYPQGFTFPLRGFIDPQILHIEIVREIFTLIMLGCIAALAAKRFTERFAYFWFCFAVWDIFYYVWLKVLLGWPQSFLTWDILFLIPWSWASPILAPIICSCTMLVLAFSIFSLEEKNKTLTINAKTWSLLIVGALLQLYTFLYDYGRIILTATEKETLGNIVSAYVPGTYNWPLFTLGEILILLAISLLFFKKEKRH